MVNILHYFLFGLSLSILPVHNCFNAIELKSTNNKVDVGEKEKRRIYCFFDDLMVSSNLFNMTINTFSIDGNEYETEGYELLSNGISAKNIDGRLWFFDIPTTASISVFSVNNKDGNTWSTSGLFKISGSVFHYSMKNYSTINSDAGWRSLSIELDQFADYFVSRLNTDSFLATDGVGQYSSLNRDIYSKISNKKTAQLDSIEWHDSFLGRDVTFKEKWELIKELSQKNSIANGFDKYTKYVLGIAISATPLIFVLVYVIRKKYGKRKEK